jgi:hypothetical protein
VTTFDPRTVHSTQPHHTGQSFTAQQQFGVQQQFAAQTVSNQQFPGLVPPPSLSKPPRNRRPMAAKIVAGAVAAGLVLGGAGAWMAFSGSSAEAAVQSTSFAGAHPTTSPFGTDAPQVAAVAATGPQTGDTAGLYAATTPPSCTTADFLTQLKADPNKLAGFGGVFQLDAAHVPAFVNSLSPVVLRANTAVTDHPFTDGAFVPEPAVLAAGTAVLVNSYGEPTVKCFNGNPLTAGAAADDAVTVVPTTQVIAQYSFTTIDNSSVVVIPGKPDPKPNPGPNPTTTPQPDPALVQKAQEAKALADQAHTDATAARQKADDADTAARIAQSGLNSAEADLAQAIQQGANPTVIATLTKVRDDAKTDLETKQNQAKFAGAAATSAEGTAAQADKNAKDAQDKADDSAKLAADTKNKDKDATKTKVDPTDAGEKGQAPAGQEGQSKVAPKPIVTGPQVCQQVVTDAAAVPNCPLTGSADAATGTTPAISGTTTTGGGKTSTGSSSQSTGSGTSKSSGSASSSSSSGSGSAGSAKGGSDK